MVGTGIGAQNGILIKGGVALETSYQLTAICFDKTGTLTVGKPIVKDFTIFAKDLSSKKFFMLTGSAEKGSEHPLAKAVIKHASNIEKCFLVSPSTSQVYSGEGIIAQVENQEICAGSQAFLEKQGIQIHHTAQETSLKYQEDANTVIFVSLNGNLAGLIAISDQIVPQARATIQYLKKLRVLTCMITGDNQGAANAIARQVY